LIASATNGEPNSMRLLYTGWPKYAPIPNYKKNRY